MTDSPDRYISPVDDRPLNYRALSMGAVASVILGLLSVLIIPTALTSLDAFLTTVLIPIAGLIVGVVSFRKIGRSPDQFTGRGIAAAGVVASSVFLITGSVLAGYVYQSEVPDGYARIDFSTLRPWYETGPTPQVVGKLPPEILQLEGQEVFITGFMRPPEFLRNIDRFLLVRDNNTCCFGPIDNVKYYDQVQVKLVGSLRADYAKRTYNMAGKLHVHPDNVGKGAGYPVFSLEADYLK